MKLPTSVRMFKSDPSIPHRAYDGYVIPAILATTGITLFAVFGRNPVLFDSVQQLLIFGSLALAYDYFSGYSGYYNLGYGSFAAVGAYTFVFTSNAGLTVFIALPLAGIAASLFAGAISYPFLRLKGAYFAIGTLALILLLRILDINLFQYTGGTAGIHVNLSNASIQPTLILGSLLFLVMMLLVHYTIGRSGFGLALRSCREEEEVAESSGVSAFRMKQIAMVLSGFFAGVAGSVYALYLGFINADNVLGLAIGLFPVVSAITGGSGIFLGPLVGNFVLTGINLTVPSVVEYINPSAIIGPLVVTGVLLVLVGLFVPGGLLTLQLLQRHAYRRVDSKITRVFRRRTGPVFAT